MAAVMSTQECLAQIRRVLDRMDHAARKTGSHAERLQLVTEVRAVSRRIRTLEAVLVTEADEANSSIVEKGTPLTSWLTLNDGTSAKEASGLVFSGRDLASKPNVQQAALSGVIGLPQARSVAKVLDDFPADLTDAQRNQAEKLLLARAARTPADKLAALGDEVLTRVAPEQALSGEREAQRLEARAKRARSRRGLSFLSDGDGAVLIRGSLPEPDAVPFRKLIDAYVEHDRRAARQGADRRDPLIEQRTPQQRCADALVAMIADHQTLCAGSGADKPSAEDQQEPLTGLGGRGHGKDCGEDSRMDGPNGAIRGAGPKDTGGTRGGEAAEGDEGIPPTRRPLPVVLPRSAGDRPRIVVIMQEQALRDRAERAGLLETGAAVAPGDLRRLCCDAELTPVVLGTRSEILDVGRAARLVTDPIRRALALRDGGCAFPGCMATVGQCEAHHIRPWWAGGRTSLGNLVMLCPHHHALVEPPRFWTGPAPDRWEIRLDRYGKPEVIPPLRVDLDRVPLPCRHGLEQFARGIHASYGPPG